MRRKTKRRKKGKKKRGQCLVKERMLHERQKTVKERIRSTSKNDERRFAPRATRGCHTGRKMKKRAMPRKEENAPRATNGKVKGDAQRATKRERKKGLHGQEERKEEKTERGKRRREREGKDKRKKSGRGAPTGTRERRKGERRGKKNEQSLKGEPG